MAANKAIRKKYLFARDNISDRDSRSRLIAEKLMALLESDFKGADIFLCFYPFGSEVDLILLYRKLMSRDKNLYFPKCYPDTKDILFFKIKNLETDFAKGHYGIMEPIDGLEQLLNFDRRVLSITPGLVFDKKCSRIGYGGGYYDRFFAKYPGIIKVAPSFGNMVVDGIDTLQHDIKMDFIVTENEIIRG